MSLKDAWNRQMAKSNAMKEAAKEKMAAQQEEAETREAAGISGWQHAKNQVEARQAERQAEREARKLERDAQKSEHESSKADRYAEELARTASGAVAPPDSIPASDRPVPPTGGHPSVQDFLKQPKPKETNFIDRFDFISVKVRPRTNMPELIELHKRFGWEYREGQRSHTRISGSSLGVSKTGAEGWSLGGEAFSGEVRTETETTHSFIRPKTEHSKRLNELQAKTARLRELYESAKPEARAVFDGEAAKIDAELQQILPVVKERWAEALRD